MNSIWKNGRLRAVRLYFRIISRLSPTRAVALAARLFTTPCLDNHHKLYQLYAVSASRRQDMAVHGHRVAVYTWGDPKKQPYALLAHGWSGCGLDFLPWIDRLREQGYAVIAFDQPGHGMSDGRRCSLSLIVSTVKQISLRFGNPAVAIGHSLGAAALVLAQDEPWQASKFLLIAPVINLNDTIGRFAHAIGMPINMHEQFHTALRSEAKLSRRKLQLKWRVRHFHQPSLIVHDLQDKIVPWVEGERYARYWPGARLLSTSGLGHRRILDDTRIMDAGMSFLCGEHTGTQLKSKNHRKVLPFAEIVMKKRRLRFKIV
jgi:pimeloyl-ACP methyl ester carboxylesterase